MIPVNTLDQHIVQEDNKCSGKGCPNAGTILLKIKYINKIGYFCDSCSSLFLDEGLAIRLEDNTSKKN
jgi:hypothetical protein